MNSLLTLTGNTGSVVNWQRSPDNTNWSGFVPGYTATSYGVTSLAATTFFRVIVKSGVCPADTSAVATINFINTPFPRLRLAPIHPKFAENRSR